MSGAMSKKFKFQNVMLDHAQPLGSGYYGNTYRAHCDHLLCAGKHMTPELFESTHEGGWGARRGRGEGKIKRSLITSFQNEIDCIRRICHPNLVQYLGSYIDTDSQLPILLMELCHDNLTSYLDKAFESLFYHEQLSLLHDIVLALVFLHSHCIVHGNLSSNNVFIVPYAIPLAKISDYGICRMNTIAKNSSGYYRGNSAYLPPDPLVCLQRNGAKVDCYSWGVLATQVLTQQLPLPPPKQAEAGPAPTIEDHHKTVLALADPTHPLLPIIKSALRQQEGHRPPSDVINYSLAELKTEKEFRESFEKQGERTLEKSQLERKLCESRREVERLTKELTERKQQVVVRRYEREVDQKEKTIKRLSYHLAEAKEDAEICKLEMNVFVGGASSVGKGNSELSSHGLSGERQEGDGMNTLETAARGGRGLEAVGADVPPAEEGREEVDYPSTLLQTGSLGHPKKRRWSLLRKSSTLPDIQQPYSKPVPTLTVRVGTSALSAMVRGYAAVGENGKAYFTPFSSSDRRIYSCQLHKHSKSLSWLVVPECPNFEYGLVIVNDALTAVGGYQQEYRPSQPTNCLLTYSEARRQWTERFPPMQNKRRLPAVVTTPSLLVVAGGNGSRNEILTVVEVMSLQTLQWSSAGQLPLPLTHASATLHGDCVHIAGGQSTEGAIQAHFTSQVTGALGREKLSAWKNSYKTPTLWCTLASLAGNLLAVGGQDENKNCSNAIFMYDPKFDIWVKAGSMRHKRSACFVAVPGGANSGVMVVVGGFIRKNEVTNAAEVITST